MGNANSTLVLEKIKLKTHMVGFWIKLNQAERLVLRGFPDEYSTYKARVKARVKALIPYVF